MNWLNLLTLILSVAVEELPAIEGIIKGVAAAAAPHQAVANQAVSAALVSKGLKPL